MEIDREAILQTYLAESEEHLGKMEEALVALETHPENEELLEAIFRGAHTIKGNSSSLGFPRLAEFAHAFEELLQRIRSRTVPVTRDLVTLLLRSVDALRQMVPKAVAGGEEIRPGHTALLWQLAEQIPVTSKEELGPDPAVADRRTKPWGRRQEDIQAWGERSGTIRVDVEKLDRMLNLVGEIAIARGRLTEMMAKEVGRTEIQEARLGIDTLFLQFQELVMKVRMVPVGPIFRQYIRTVRDLAQAVGKVARLAIEGE
ncbi:MAG: Hpt domain-containing protein, partial [Candidatus Binatia bacterium]